MISIKNRFNGQVIYEGDYNTILEALSAAIKSGANLYGANLSGANLSGADLSGANLYGADLYRASLSGANLAGADLYRASLSGSSLSGANLSGASLSGANLSGANLSGASLSGANLSGANLSGADLYGADLAGADLAGADLSGADLSGADLYGADLSGVKNAELAIAQTRILSEGELIGWKKLAGGIICKLKIPHSAKRSHAFGRKCRASSAEVLEIIGAEFGVSDYDPAFIYRVGEVVTPKEPFSDDWQNECASGIHFYITKIEAEKHN